MDCHNVDESNENVGYNSLNLEFLLKRIRTSVFGRSYRKNCQKDFTAKGDTWSIITPSNKPNLNNSHFRNIRAKLNSISQIHRFPICNPKHPLPCQAIKNNHPSPENPTQINILPFKICQIIVTKLI